MVSLDSLDELLHEELKDIYDAEKQLTKALPKLAKKATASELKEAFDAHLRQTEDHVERLEQVEVSVVQGSDRNIKITRPSDMDLARLFHAEEVAGQVHVER